MIVWSARLPAAQAWAFSGLLLVLGGLGDLLTGTELWFGPVYLLIICFPAWALGWRQAILVGMACLSVALLVNGPALYPLGAVALAWNMLMRVVNVAIIVLLVHGARRSYDHERMRARTDGLTGLLNKRAFFEDAAVAMRRDGRWRLLAYVDLDGFKQINDRFGHAEGDRLLRAFAASARAAIRADDVLARIGGDEFLLLASADSEAQTIELAGKLHERLNAAMAELGHCVNCSTGALVIAPEATALNPDDIHLADQAMYEAKRQGAALVVRGRRADSAAAAGAAARPSSAELPHDLAGRLPRRPAVATVA